MLTWKIRQFLALTSMPTFSSSDMYVDRLTDLSLKKNSEQLPKGGKGKKKKDYYEMATTQSP